MIEIAQAIGGAVLITLFLYTLLILSLFLTAPREPLDREPFTQAEIDRIKQ